MRPCKVQGFVSATLTPGGPAIGVGAMSAGYGGSGEVLTNETTADFGFPTAAPELSHKLLI
jgi:hypothetical protein